MITSPDWREADSSPLDDLNAAIAMMRDNCGYQPNTIIMPRRHWDRLDDLYHRATLSRRAYRRWRGRKRAMRRRGLI